MSVEYYAKLERGSLGGVSASVLDAIARALQLDDAERAHLFNLAQDADGTNAAPAAAPPHREQWTVRPSLQWALDAITTAPAIVGNDRLDLLATNHLGRAHVHRPLQRPGQRRPTSPGSPSSTAPPAASTPTGTSPPT